MLDYWRAELDLNEIPILDAAWVQVLESPRAAVRELAEFAYEGTELQPTSKQVKAAERHIKR